MVSLLGGLLLGSPARYSFGLQPFEIFAQRDLLLLVFSQGPVRGAEPVAGIFFEFSHDLTSEILDEGDVSCWRKCVAPETALPELLWMSASLSNLVTTRKPGSVKSGAPRSRLADARREYCRYTPTPSRAFDCTRRLCSE